MSMVVYKYLWSAYDHQNGGPRYVRDKKGRCTPYFALLPPSAHCFALLFQIRQGCTSRLGARAWLLSLAARAFAVLALPKNLCHPTLAMAECHMHASTFPPHSGAAAVYVSLLAQSCHQSFLKGNVIKF